MATIKIKTLEALKPEDAGRKLADGGSMFGIVRTTKDPASPISVDFQWRYKTDGKLRQVRVGTWPMMTLKAIRDARNDLASEKRKGIDPIERKAAEKLKREADQAELIQNQLDRLALHAEKQARLTVRELFSTWRSLALKQRKDGGSEALRAFELDVFPLIGNVAAADVNKAHIQRIVDGMMQRDIARMTKRVLSDLRQMFGFAIDRDLIQTDPTARIKKTAIGKDTERDRVLSERELIDLIKKLPASGLVKTSQAALMIQMATLTRIGEVLGARWQDIDFQRRTWTLPNTKNGKTHTIFLSDFATTQLEDLKAITGGVTWLFPNSTLDGPINPKAVTKQVADRQREGEGLKNRTQQTKALQLQGGQWRPHDLRRTGASYMVAPAKFIFRQPPQPQQRVWQSKRCCCTSRATQH